jgi:hypothetical protein
VWRSRENAGELIGGVVGFTNATAPLPPTGCGGVVVSALPRAGTPTNDFSRGSDRMTRKHFLLVSDFDQTLSFNDSGHVLSDMLGISTFTDKVAGLSQLNLVQSGAELSYLLLHDPEFRRVRRPDLVEVGRRIRLKRNISLLTSFL